MTEHRMQSPIFSPDTVFPVIGPEGRTMQPGSTEPVLFPGCYVKRMKEPVDLIEIETRSGQQLRLSPESVFSLVKDSGKVVLFNAPDATLAGIKVPRWSEPIAGDLFEDYRRWFLVAAILSGGNYSADWNRPTRLILSANDKRAKPIAAFVQRIAGEPVLRDKHHAPFRVSISFVGDRSIITSRVLDRLVGTLLEPKTKRMFFDPGLLTQRAFHGFVSGLLAGLDYEGDKAVFTHRDRYVVEMVHRVMNDRAGIPADLHVSDMEPDLQRRSDVTTPHRVELRSRALNVCRFLGLIPCHERPAQDHGIVQQDIIRVQRLGKQDACILICEHDDPDHTTANSFLVRPVFAVDPVITDLATMPAVFMDPARSPVPQTTE